MSINEISKWLEESGLVAIAGEDLDLIKDYIDDKCIIIIPKKYHKEASWDMGSTHIEESYERRK
tara:strand:- start:1272 stop:1463 length:192 start_codon:yes stop_codon:yes gene_type:complete